LVPSSWSYLQHHKGLGGEVTKGDGGTANPKAEIEDNSDARFIWCCGLVFARFREPRRAGGIGEFPIRVLCEIRGQSPFPGLLRAVVAFWATHPGQLKNRQNISAPKSTRSYPQRGANSRNNPQSFFARPISPKILCYRQPWNKYEIGK
jgi:hypothetical protein